MMRNFFLSCCVLSLLAGCASGPRVKPAASTVPKSGGYYLDDGPGDAPPPDLLAIPDAVPRVEPLHRGANRPYEALGTQYTPITELGVFRQEGVASWYGRRYHGKPTSSGETYDMYGMTAAHPILPIPSYARVTALDSGKSVIVRINDRGPFHSDRVIDLSYTAAFKLGVAGKGSGRVRVESIDPAQMAAMTASPPNAAVADAAAATAANQSGHYVQLGAFGNVDNAEKLLQRARDALGIPNQLSRVVLAGELHRVRLGPFASEAEAGVWVDRTRSALGMDAVKIVYY